MTMFSAAAIVLLCVHTVCGFGMIDYLRAARHLEAQHLQRSLSSPVDAIVDVVKGELDSDENGEISMPEIEAYIYRYFNPNNIQPFTLEDYNKEGKGYILTLANLIDANRDGNITTAELRRPAEILVNTGGDIMVARIIQLKMSYNGRLPSFSPQAEAIKAVGVFMDLADSNKDGEMSNEEMEVIFGLPLFRWYYGEVGNDIGTADANFDGKLNRAEAEHFLTSISWWKIKHILCYLEIYERVGKQIADEYGSSW